MNVGVCLCVCVSACVRAWMCVHVGVSVCLSVSLPNVQVYCVLYLEALLKEVLLYVRPQVYGNMYNGLNKFLCSRLFWREKIC